MQAADWFSTARWSLLTAFCLLARPALAEPQPVLLLPTAATPANARGDQEPPRARRSPEEDVKLDRLRQQVDAILSEAVQDLGLTSIVAQHQRPSAPSLAEESLIASAEHRWVISPRVSLDRERDRFLLTILAVSPGSQVVRTRSERVRTEELDVQAMRMLRDLVASADGPSPACPSDVPQEEPRGVSVTPAHSPGRAVLALNSAAAGGFVGYALQRASGSNDARVTYPLTALGAGVGLGASMIVADEWDVGVGDAWYLSAGAVWPTLGAYLLAAGYEVTPTENRYLYALGGTVGGLAAATVSLTVTPIDAGGAALTHSGGAVGLLLGALTESAVRGTTDVSPRRGMGYGSMIGVGLGGTFAALVPVDPSRVLLVDLLAGIGGLTGAAVASPAVFGDQITEQENRIWLSSIAAGIVAGATIGGWVTRPHPERDPPRPPIALLPFAGVVAEGLGPFDPPPVGGGVRGTW